MTPEEIEKAAEEYIYSFEDIPADKRPPLIPAKNGFKAGAEFMKENGIRWRKIDPENLPKDQVLVLLYNNTIDFGRIMKNDQGEMIVFCETWYVLKAVKGYIYASDLRNLPAEE